MEQQIVEFILGFAMQYPKVASVLLIIGGFRAFMKPIFSLAHAYVSFTPNKKDDEILDQVEKSKAYSMFVYALDYIFSAKIEKPKQ